jgi:excisionase family DNA binding protein
MGNTRINTLNQLPKLLKVKDVALLLNISPAYAYQLINKNEIPHFKFQKRIFVPKQIFFDWLENFFK